jgi:hypothetical protein
MMIDQPAPNADYLDRPDVRARLRARPVATYLGARRGVLGYALLIVVTVAGAIDAWRDVSPWLGAVIALVAAHAIFDWMVSWYRVASLAYHQAVEQVYRDRPETSRDCDPSDPEATHREPPPGGESDPPR